MPAFLFVDKLWKNMEKNKKNPSLYGGFFRLMKIFTAAANNFYKSL